MHAVGITGTLCVVTLYHVLSVRYIILIFRKLSCLWNLSLLPWECINLLDSVGLHQYTTRRSQLWLRWFHQAGQPAKNGHMCIIAFIGSVNTEMAPTGLWRPWVWQCVWSTPTRKTDIKLEMMMTMMMTT